MSSTSAATTQGMPSWRAMIAVWLVGPPRLVASAITLVGSSPAVSAGARSSATRTDGDVGHRDAGLGQPLQLGDDAAAEVAQVGDALGHQAAELLEHRRELVDRGSRRGLGRRAAGDRLVDRLAQTLVRRPGRPAPTAPRPPRRWPRVRGPAVAARRSRRPRRTGRPRPRALPATIDDSPLRSTDAVGRMTGPTAMPGTTGVPSRTLLAESAGADVLGAMKVYLVREPGAGSVGAVDAVTSCADDVVLFGNSLFSV